MKNKIRDVLDIGPDCYERFIHPNKLAQVAALEIELAGCSNLSGRYCVARTAPVDHTLFYTLNGKGKLRTATTTYDLQPGSIAILPAKQAFEVSIAHENWDIFWLNLASTACWQHLQLTSAMVVEQTNLGSLHLALELFYSEENVSLCDALAPILSFHLHNLLNTQAENSNNDRLGALFQEIEKRLQFAWSIQNMSEYVHYSPPHLHRLCQRRYNRSPIQQLIYLRMERAKNLLVNTAWSVSDIASYVGYANVFNFSKRFKKSTGFSPSVYRSEN